jgi:transforming growth factor-beta-induced protein
VLGAKVEAGDLVDSYATTASTGPNGEQIVLQIDVTGGVKFNGGTMPITTDVQATNGVIHVIDKVMLPPSVVNLALNNDNFSILVSALTRPDLSTDFVSILSGDGPFTIFAPTNQAFINLLDDTPAWSSLDDIPTATLEAVLAYHAVSGANVQSSQLTNGQTITTLGGTMTADLSSTPKLTTSSGQSVNIILTDVQGTNGVIHAVDTVLLP